MSYTPTNEREYYFGEILKGNITPPKRFQPNLPERPAEPDITGLDDSARAAAYLAYSKEYEAWRTAAEAARITQWAGVLADAAVENKTITIAASNEAGTGTSDPPPPYVPPHQGDVP